MQTQHNDTSFLTYDSVKPLVNILWVVKPKEPVLGLEGRIEGYGVPLTECSLVNSNEGALWHNSNLAKA